jgi:hypothetical protein
MNQQELYGLGFVAWNLELLKQRDSGKKKVEAVVFMAPLRFVWIFQPASNKKGYRIRGNFEAKDYLLQNWGACIDTVFFGKTGQKDMKEQPMREQGNQPIEEREREREREREIVNITR